MTIVDDDDPTIDTTSSADPSWNDLVPIINEDDEGVIHRDRFPTPIRVLD